MEKQQDLQAADGTSAATGLPSAQGSKPLAETIASATAESLSKSDMKNMQDHVKGYLQQHGAEKTKRLLFETYKALRQIRRQGHLDDEEARYRAEEQIHLIFEDVVH